MISLFSYGILFELERGQYDLIAMFLCIAAIYLFHFHPRLRIPAYLLFCIAVQLKIYPLIFIVALIDYSQPVSTHLKRWGALLLANFLLLFMLGLRPFMEFKQAMLTQLRISWLYLAGQPFDQFLYQPAAIQTRGIQLESGPLR